MNEWWDGLTRVNQGFYTAAIVFGVLFLWQLISALIGIDADGTDMDAPDDLDIGDGFDAEADADAFESLSSFHLLSFRSIIAFFTLFTWGTSMYLQNSLLLPKAMGLGFLWGLTGMFLVAGLLFMLKKLSESGNKNMNSCIGTTGTVYLNIPEGGQGEVKVLVSNVSTHVKARGAGGKAIEANKTVKVIKRVGQDIFEVEEV